MQTRTFEFSTAIEIDAPPELVFRFFTESELVERWHGTQAECDARPGGLFFLNVTGADIKIGEFIELDPPKRLVFTWGHEHGIDDFPPGSSTVVVTLEPIKQGTRVHIHHYGLPSEEQRDSHRLGWAHYLGRLGIVAAGNDPGPDAWRKCDPPGRRRARVGRHSTLLSGEQ